MNYTYKMPKRGLTSVLNSLLGLYLEHSIDGKGQIFIDSSESPYFMKVGFFDIYKTNSIFTNQRANDSVHISEKYSRKYAWIKEQDILSNTTISQRSIAFSYQDDILFSINNNIKALNLPQHYFCFHIRRGDKITQKEANKYEFGEYLDKVKEITGIDSIFIMSDDFASILEAKKYLLDNKLDYNLYYMTGEDLNGHSSQLNIEENREYTKEQIVSFITEIEVAKSCSHFVGTNSSNVFRFIKNTSTTPTFISLD